MSNKVIRLDTLKKNVYDINKYDPDYMFNLKAFVNYAIKYLFDMNLPKAIDKCICMCYTVYIVYIQIYTEV